MAVFGYVSPTLWIIVGLAIVLAIVISLCRHPLGQGISNILLNVAFSIIASFIFYTVVVLAPRAREYEAAAPFISRQIVTLKGDVEAVCREAARASGRKLPAEWTFNRGEVVDIFNAARLRAPVDMVFPDGRQGNLFDYIVDRVRRTNIFLRDLLILSPLLGGEGKAQIGDIQSDAYLMQVQALQVMSQFSDDQTLAFLVDSLDNHYQQITRLEKWAAGNHLLTNPWVNR